MRLAGQPSWHAVAAPGSLLPHPGPPFARTEAARLAGAGPEPVRTSAIRPPAPRSSTFQSTASRPEAEPWPAIRRPVGTATLHPAAKHPLALRARPGLVADAVLRPA